MKKQSFLGKIKRQGKIELVDPSKEIMDSYLDKSASNLSASRDLLGLDYIEESISLSYYAMYNCLTALLFRCGIKCENHVAAILLLHKIFEEKELYEIISFAKDERIDKQYYVDFHVTKQDAQELIDNAEDFTVKIKVIIQSLTQKEITQIREKIKAI
jgi:uncharacterized protein (UPF0332 family)